MYVSGGDGGAFGSGAKPLGDFWILDLTEWTWRQVEVPAKFRAVRMGHTSYHAVISDDMYMHPDEGTLVPVHCPLFSFRFLQRVSDVYA